jgi:LysM repeat protein
MLPLHTRRVFSRHNFSLALAVLAVAVGCLASACQTRVEEQDAFKDLVDRVERSEKDVDAMRRQLSVVDRDLQQVSLDVSNVVKSGAGMNPQAVSALNQRLQQVESSLKTASEAVNAFDDRIKNIEKAGSGRVAAGHKSAEKETAAATDADTRKTRLVVRQKNEAPAGAKPVQAAAAKPAAPAGVYHMIELGETIEQIARSYKVPVERLQAANRLPAGRQLIAGQPLFVPRRR